MQRRQPDDRIRPENLGMVTLNGKRFVINLCLGVPFNACIEEFRGFLRCWASYNWLNRSAASLVDGHATQTGTGAFVWNNNVRFSRVSSKGGHDLYRVIFP